MATPAVAGAVALLLQETQHADSRSGEGAADEDRLQDGLVSTAAWVPHLCRPSLDFYDLFSVGSGLLNVQARYHQH